MSIDYNDMCLSFALLISGCGRLFVTVDWFIAMICHYVIYCLPVDDSNIWSGFAVVLGWMMHN